MNNFKKIIHMGLVVILLSQSLNINAQEQSGGWLWTIGKTMLGTGCVLVSGVSFLIGCSHSSVQSQQEDLSKLTHAQSMWRNDKKAPALETFNKVQYSWNPSRPDIVEKDFGQKPSENFIRKTSLYKREIRKQYALKGVIDEEYIDFPRNEELRKKRKEEVLSRMDNESADQYDLSARNARNAKYTCYGVTALGLVGLYYIVTGTSK